MRGNLLASFEACRNATVTLTKPLVIEDFVVQAMKDASPPKWHLAHTTWFFETFLLQPFEEGFAWHDEAYQVLFNSYYESVGPQFHRPNRSHLSRPTVEEVLAYRAAIEDRLAKTFEARGRDEPEFLRRLALGIHHEQQHQELLLMDVKFNFSRNPIYPVYLERQRAGANVVPVQNNSFFDLKGGQVSIGASADEGFAFDNEFPKHEVLLRDYSLARHLVTNGEYLAFMEDGGYRRPEFWLADGFEWLKREEITAPEYWRLKDAQYFEFQLTGLEPLALGSPVQHVSYYEADAYARWCGRRLPSEAEWENAARVLQDDPARGFFFEDGHLTAMAQEAPSLYGNLWQWTQSPYVSFPGFVAARGSLGEYNGKFMCNQFVMRGGSYLSPRDHIRASYRNFFYPHMRWQASGIRLG